MTGEVCLGKNWERSRFTVTIDKTAKIWQPTTILQHDRNIDIGAKCRIGQHCFIAPKTLVMEHGAEISPLVVIGGGGNVYMCKYSTIDYGARLIPATFTTKGLYMNDAMLEENPKNVDIINGSITLKEGAVVASNAVICVSKEYPEIIIGEHSVIGAGMYVDKPIPPNVVIRPRYFEPVIGARR